MHPITDMNYRKNGDAFEYLGSWYVGMLVKHGLNQE